MAESKAKITTEQATQEVRVMAKRTAMLYYHFATVLIEKLGVEEGKKIISEVISRYGSEVGQSVQKAVLDKGLPLTLENYSLESDLPKYGWEGSEFTKEGKNYIEVKFCPLAAEWMSRDFHEIGRLYCFVDQAKYDSYNGTKCIHLKNKLDGDEICLFDFEVPQEKGAQSNE